MILISRTDLIVFISIQIIECVLQFLAQKTWSLYLSSLSAQVLESEDSPPQLKCYSEMLGGKAMMINRVIRVSGWGPRTSLSPSWYLIMPDCVLFLLTLLLTHFLLHSQVAEQGQSNNVWRKVVEEDSPGFCFCDFLFRVGTEKSEYVVQTWFLTWDFWNFCLNDLEV